MARIQMNPAQAGGQRQRGAAPHPHARGADDVFGEGVICLPRAWGFCVWRGLRCWGFLFIRAAVPAVGASSVLEGARRWPEHPHCQNIPGALSTESKACVHNPNRQKAFFYEGTSGSSDPLSRCCMRIIN